MVSRAIRGYVIHPSDEIGDGIYIITELRDRVISGYGRTVERKVIDKSEKTPDEALDVAMYIWDKTGRPVCVYLEDIGKITFDNFWASIVAYDRRWVEDLGKYLGHSGSEMSDLIPLRIYPWDRVADAFRFAIGLDPTLPQVDEAWDPMIAVPYSAIKVWRRYSDTNRHVQGFRYITGHPIVKSVVRAFFDLADEPYVRLVFDSERGSMYGWYRIPDGVIYMNYAAFATAYILGKLGIYYRDEEHITTATAGTIVHEMTHHAEITSGYEYDGEWAVDPTTGRKRSPVGSELIAYGAERVGAVGLLAHDLQYVTKYIRSEFDCDIADVYIEESEVIQDFGRVMDLMEVQYGGVIRYIKGVYVPFEHGPYLEYDVRLELPQETKGAVMHMFEDSQFDVAWTDEFQGEGGVAVMDGTIYVPAGDQQWIVNAEKILPSA